MLGISAERRKQHFFFQSRDPSRFDWTPHLHHELIARRRRSIWQ